MSNSNIETTKKGYAAFAAGDMDGALSIFDDNIEWTLTGNSAISGTYHGKAEVTGLLGQLAEKSATVKTLSFLGDGDVVVALTEVAAGGETGPEADVFTYRDGKIAKAQSFGDTAMQERIFGTKQVAAG